MDKKEYNHQRTVEEIAAENAKANSPEKRQRLEAEKKRILDAQKPSTKESEENSAKDLHHSLDQIMNNVNEMQDGNEQTLPAIKKIEELLDKASAFIFEETTTNISNGEKLKLLKKIIEITQKVRTLKESIVENNDITKYDSYFAALQYYNRDSTKVEDITYADEHIKTISDFIESDPDLSNEKLQNLKQQLETFKKKVEASKEK